MHCEVTHPLTHSHPPSLPPLPVPCMYSMYVREQGEPNGIGLARMLPRSFFVAWLGPSMVHRLGLQLANPPPGTVIRLPLLRHPRSNERINSKSLHHQIEPRSVCKARLGKARHVRHTYVTFVYIYLRSRTIVPFSAEAPPLKCYPSDQPSIPHVDPQPFKASQGLWTLLYCTYTATLLHTQTLSFLLSHAHKKKGKREKQRLLAGSFSAVH